MFGELLEMYGHGLTGSTMHAVNADILDLCYSSSKTEAGAAACIAKGHGLKTYQDKKQFLQGLAEGLKKCPYVTCMISTPGDPAVSPGITTA